MLAKRAGLLGSGNILTIVTVRIHVLYFASLSIPFDPFSLPICVPHYQHSTNSVYVYLLVHNSSFCSVCQYSLLSFTTSGRGGSFSSASLRASCHLTFLQYLFATVIWHGRRGTWVDCRSRIMILDHGRSCMRYVLGKSRRLERRRSTGQG
jgi:hypothetical protein